MPGRDMPVERVPAGVEPPPGKPAVKRRPRVIEHAVPAPLPVDRLGRLRPEFLRPLQRPAIRLSVVTHRVLPDRSAYRQVIRTLEKAGTAEIRPSGRATAPLRRASASGA